MTNTSPHAQIERWFLRRGIPLFIRDYRAGTRVWTRALPFLLLADAILAIPFGAGWASGVGGWVTAVGMLAVVVVLNNLIDRHRPFGRPRRVGPLVLLAVVVGPAVARLVAGQFSAALPAALVAAVIVVATYGVVAYGLVPLSAWTVRRLARSLPELKNAAVRALPLMLMFLTFFLFTAEVWQAIGPLRGLPYVATLLLFGAAAVAYTATRMHGQVETIEQFESWADIRRLSTGTPAEALRPDEDLELVADPLDRRERRNVALVMLVNQAVMAVSVAFVVGLFFLVLGFLTIDADVVATWTTRPAHVWASWTWNERTLVLSSEHLRVAGFLAAFSGFYFAVYSASDPTVREGLTDEGTTQIRQACAVRQIYRTRAAR